MDYKSHKWPDKAPDWTWFGYSSEAPFIGTLSPKAVLVLAGQRLEM